MELPHFALPFQIVGSTAATVEQDSIEDVSACVQVLVSTTVGERVEVPTYGVPDPVFSNVKDATPGNWISAIRKWEPRAATMISDQVSTVDELVRRLRVNVSETDVGHKQ